MEKYLTKAKSRGELAVMEVSPQSSFGVRTRARTLALHRLRKPSPPPDESLSYIQLRSRRLEKLPVSTGIPKEACKEKMKSSPNSKLGSPVNRSRAAKMAPSSGAANYGLAVSVSVSVSVSPTSGSSVALEPPSAKEAEVSFGENVLEVEGQSRTVRETTPSSLIRDSEGIGTPGSSTRPSYSATTNRKRDRSPVYKSIPTIREMEEFFTGAEQAELKLFTEKYNYDPVNDCPLPGRYEWAKLE